MTGRDANKSRGTSSRKPEMLVTPVAEETSAAVGTAATAETLAKAGTKRPATAGLTASQKTTGISGGTNTQQGRQNQWIHLRGWID